MPSGPKEDIGPGGWCRAGDASFSSSSPSYALIPGIPEMMPATGTPSTPQDPWGSCSTALAAAPWSQSDQDSSHQEEEGPGTLQVQPDAESLLRDAIDDKVVDLVKFLLFKYRMKEPTTRAEMLKAVIKNHKDHFSVIFREASECLQLVFGIEVKEVDPASQCYVLTRDWVQEKYLEYQRVTSSEPVCYEFLWGPRAHAKTSKMKVLEFLAKVHSTIPSAFPTWYEEALREEEERAMSSISSRPFSSSLTHPSKA